MGGGGESFFHITVGPYNVASVQSTTIYAVIHLHMVQIIAVYVHMHVATWCKTLLV